MKLKVFKFAKVNTTYLQGIGHVEGTPAGNLVVGNTLVWNNGSTSKVVGIVKETEKTIVILEEYEDNYSPTGKTQYERKLLKTRIVARPAVELPGNEPEPENDLSGRATSPQDEEQVPAEGSVGEPIADVVLVTTGPEVDLVTELFDNPDREKLLNGNWEVTEETDFSILAAKHFPGNQEPEPKKVPYGYYPNQVTFDRVSRLYPGFKVVGIEEFYIDQKTGWRKPEDVIGKVQVSLYAPEELVEYLRDIYGAVTFCLIIEDKGGRRKNPDYKYKELIVGLEPGDEVLYVPEYAKGDKSHPDAEKGIVSSVRVEEGRASVWVRYTDGDTGAKTNLSNLYKL